MHRPDPELLRRLPTRPLAGGSNAWDAERGGHRKDALLNFTSEEEGAEAAAQAEAKHMREASAPVRRTGRWDGDDGDGAAGGAPEAGAGEQPEPEPAPAP